MTGLNVIEYGGNSSPRLYPLLFVHGVCMGAWCWKEHFLPYFARLGYHAVALDLRGHGGSAGRDRLQETTIDDYVADVAEVANRFPMPPVVLGHSMGGLITQRFMSRHPASGAVLMASSPVNGMRRYGWAFVRTHPWPLLKAQFTRDLRKIYPDNRRVRHFMFSPGTPEHVVTRFQERLQPESWRACREMEDPIVPTPRITCPTLVMGGELDHTVPVEAVRKTAEAYQTPAQIFANIGHSLMLEPSWQDVADCIDRWVQATLRPNQGLQAGP